MALKDISFSYLSPTGNVMYGVEVGGHPAYLPDFLKFISIMEELYKIGFEKNTKIINGFKPPFKRGNDVLFIIRKHYYISKIIKIGQAFRHYEGKVYGLAINESNELNVKDWDYHPYLTLLKL